MLVALIAIVFVAVKAPTVISFATNVPIVANVEVNVLTTPFTIFPTDAKKFVVVALVVEEY